jgi:hypothetical protein
MSRDTRLHGRRQAQRLMDAAKVAVHEVQCDGVNMVSTFLEKPFFRRVKRPMLMHIDKFWRSPQDVETCFMPGAPSTAVRSSPMI